MKECKYFCDWCGDCMECYSETNCWIAQNCTHSCEAMDETKQ